MASTTTKSESVRFDKPEDWIKFSREFRIQARNLDLWIYIDPENKIPWLGKPVRPEISNYPKKLVRASTRASSQTSATPAPEEVDPRSTPSALSEMTAEGKADFLHDRQEYLELQKVYDKHRTNVTTLSNWIVSTTATAIRESCCDEDKTIDEWYLAFKQTGAPYEALQVINLRTRYQAAIKPLSKMPRNFSEWIREWETTMIEGQRIEYPETKMANIWARDLIKALEHALPSWSSTALGIHRTKINDDTLNFREVVAEIRDHWATHSYKTPTRIARGAFPTFGQDDDKPASYEEGVSDTGSVYRTKEKRKDRTQKKTALPKR